MSISHKMASSKVDEQTVNVENLNKPKQTTVDQSKKETNQHELKKLEHVPQLSRTAIVEKQLENDEIALTTSNDRILIYNSTKFLLFDQQLEQIKEFEWKEYDSSGILTIDDLTFLSCQNSFLVLTRSYIYELNIDSFEIKLLEEFTKKDKSGEDTLAFASITAYNDHIFVASANAAAVTKWAWKPTLQLVNRWTKTKVVEENDQTILSIRTDGTHVGLLVKGETSTRLEVFDFNLSTRIVHHLEISPTATMLTTLVNNQWLVIDTQQNELHLVNEDNRIDKTQNKDSSPLNAARLDNDYLVVKCQKPNKLQIFKFD